MAEQYVHDSSGFLLKKAALVRDQLNKKTVARSSKFTLPNTQNASDFDILRAACVKNIHLERIC